MYCHNCGKQIPDGAKFCTGCGAAQLIEDPAGAAAPQPAPARPAPARPAAAPVRQPARPQPGAHTQPAPKKKKRHTGVIIAVCAVVVAAAVALGIFVIAPMMKGKNEGTAGVTDLPGGGASAAGGEDTSYSDAYYQMCEPFGYLPPTSALIVQRGLDDPAVEYFVQKFEDGSYVFHDYAANGDTVVNYVETIMLPLESMTDEQKAQIEQQVQDELAKLDGYDFIDASFVAGKWGRLRFECTGLDQAEHSQTLYELGVFTEPGPYSLSLIKQSELDAGYISRNE